MELSLLIKFAISLIILLILAVLKDQRDRIHAKKMNILSPWQDSPVVWKVKLYFWYVENRWKNTYSAHNIFGNLWFKAKKYVLTFLLDGWHFNEYLIWFYTWLLTGILLSGSVIYGFGVAVILQTLFGWIFIKLHHRKNSIPW